MIRNYQSMELSDKVIEAKTALMNALGDNQQKYLNNLKMWFRHKWNKEELDIESRKLLNPETVHLHNRFLLAVLNKIRAFSSPQEQHSTSNLNDKMRDDNSSNRRKRKRNTSRFTSGLERPAFEPYDICDYLMDYDLDIVRPPNSTDDNPQSIPPQRFCVQELFLPDIGFMMGRFLVSAWEFGLVNVEDAVAEYTCVAVQILLKNIISTIIMKRKYARTTGEGCFYYDVGASIKDPFLRNTVTRQKIDDTPIEIDKEITSVNVIRKPNDDNVLLSACEELYPQKKHVITLRDVYNALKDKNIMGSHLVYAVNMERIVQMLQ